MPVRRGLLAALVCVCVAGCGKQSQAPEFAPTVNQALSACKISSIKFVLNKSEGRGQAGKKAIDSHFESCMNKEGWRRLAECRPKPDGKPVHPMSAYAFVKTQCYHSFCQLATCYQQVKTAG